jgi:predicted metalloprotease
VPFNTNSRLDPSQVQDRRGGSGGWRVGRSVAVGGGGIGLVILVVAALVLGANPSDLLNLVGADVSAPSQQDTSSISDIQTMCQTGADANNRQDCQIVGYVNSIQDYWSSVFDNYGLQYSSAQTVLYSGSTQGACGYASPATGPFYCPSDQMVYLDLSFFDDMKSKFGAQGGAFTDAYVLAHEYGHHVQDLLGLLDQSGGNATGPQSMSVFTELQADCLAGVWVHHVAETGYLTTPTTDEIAQALDAAASVGDDRIQRETQGNVSPDSWTHGSSQQRQAALIDGMQSGDINTCETPGY